MRHLDEAFPFSVRQTSSSLLRVLSAHTARHDAGSCGVAGFSYWKRVLGKLKPKHGGTDGHLQLYIFTNSTISLSFPLLPFYFEAIKKLSTLRFQQWQSRNTLFMFPRTKTITLYFDHSTYMGYNIVKNKAATSAKCSKLYFIFKF